MGVHIIVLIEFLLLLRSSAFVQESDIELTNKLPCDFLDTVNITDGTYFPNKSILFNGVEFRKELYAKVDFLDLRTHKILKVAPHIRGCLCSIRPCLRFCCPEGTFLELSGESGMCSPKNVTVKMHSLNIVNPNNETKLVKMEDHFGVVHNFPCKKIFLPAQQFQITHVSKWKANWKRDFCF